jgi:hypothetical protein
VPENDDMDVEAQYAEALNLIAGKNGLSVADVKSRMNPPQSHSRDLSQNGPGLAKPTLSFQGFGRGSLPGPKVQRGGISSQIPNPYPQQGLSSGQYLPSPQQGYTQPNAFSFGTTFTGAPQFIVNNIFGEPSSRIADFNAECPYCGARTFSPDPNGPRKCGMCQREFH